MKWSRLKISGPVVIVCVCLIAFGQAQTKTAQQYHEAGVEKLNSGFAFKAILDFQSALRINPNYTDAQTGLSKSYILTGAPESALVIFNKILKIHPDHEQSLIGIGQALTMLGRYDQALDEFERTVTLYPRNADAHFGMANLYYLMNKKTWAQRRIDTVLKINPLHYDTIILQAVLKSEEGRLRDAEALIKKAVLCVKTVPPRMSKWAFLCCGSI
jgi:tetratricopeptide (TPR) repeat protein